MDHKKSISEYQIIEPTKDKEIKKTYWEIAIGLQQVDRLRPSEYLLELAKEHIEGVISNDEVETGLHTYYSNIDQELKKETYECDIVSLRIVELLDQGSFTFSPAMLKSIHKYLFKDVLDDSVIGVFRNTNIRKKEEILYGETVNYANYFSIDEIYAYDFEQERRHKYSAKPTEKEILNLTKFTSAIWQVHPFMEGNTRTTAVFIELYLKNMGYSVDNEPFKNNSEYFRNALVRSNYANVAADIEPTFIYLKKFYENLLFLSKHPLDNQELYCRNLKNIKTEG